MTVHSLKPGSGARLHQFVTGAIPVAAYVIGWDAPVWVAVFLSLAALLSVRLIVVGQLWSLFRPVEERPTLLAFYHGVHRSDEAVRAILLGGGLALLLKHQPIGWLPVLAASSIAVLAGTTSFSFVTVFYAMVKSVVDRVFRHRRAGSAAVSAGAGNPNCMICRSLGQAPYNRCTWCNLPSIRSCCALQTSLLMALLLVIAFLLTASLEPVVTKVLVTMSIIAVVALGLAITRQTEDLVISLEGLADAERRADDRCAFLKRLALAESVEGVAEETVAFAEATLKALRISLMVADENVLHIAASRGIPEETVRQTSVPIGERICGRVFSSGRPVVMRNILSERPHEALGLQGASGAVASYPLVAAQMSAAGRKIGVINATDVPGGEFSPAELAELEFIAEAAAISLASQQMRDDLERANFSALVTLALTMEAKDPYTNGHSVRVRRWADAAGRRLGLEGTQLKMLTYAAELHDIGKLAVPDSILQAPRRLTDVEWVIMREHPRRGVELIKHLTFLKDAQPAILHHHERYDGTGYPDGLKGDRIPLEARILAVIDAYDAMTTVRAYRPAMSHEMAVAELRHCSGAQFAPDVVDAFLRVLGDELAGIAVEEAALATS